MDNNSFATEYISYTRKRLLEEYFPKIKRCLNELSNDDIWWRAHETDNSIGNLILHLCGNVRQWIITGIGGAQDVRERSKEFSEREHISKEELLTKMESTLQEADSVLKNCDISKLLEVKKFQVYEVTYLDAISHVVEHFSMHTGQIIYITKLRTAQDLKFYNL